MIDNKHFFSFLQVISALSAGGNQPIVVQTLGQPTLQSAIPQAIQVLPIGSLGNLQVRLVNDDFKF